PTTSRYSRVLQACCHRAMIRRSLVLLRGLSVFLRLILLLNSFIAAPEPSDQCFKSARFGDLMLALGNLNERRCGDAMLQYEQFCVNPSMNALLLFGSQRAQDRKIVALFASRSRGD